MTVLIFPQNEQRDSTHNQHHHAYASKLEVSRLIVPVLAQEAIHVIASQQKTKHISSKLHMKRHARSMTCVADVGGLVLMGCWTQTMFPSWGWCERSDGGLLHPAHAHCRQKATPGDFS
eukprot:2605833-Amphidinium_carterae.1